MAHKTLERAAGQDQEQGSNCSDSDNPELRKISVAQTKSRAGSRKQDLFPDIDEFKKKAIGSSGDEVAAHSAYHDTGHFQRLAKNGKFEHLTLFVIAFNAMWLWIDTDYNKASTMVEADLHFQIVDNLFCMYFVFEVIVRFGAYRYKHSCLKDAWFVFDSMLAVTMIIDTWIMSIVMLSVASPDGDASSDEGASSGASGTSVLKVFRLVRLTRMARVARLLKAVPELVILMKGMMAATRSVFFTLLLLSAVVYVFGIGFTQMCDETETGRIYFATVPDAMYTLVLQGTFLDEITAVVSDMRKDTDLFALAFLFFTVITGFLVMNMLIGVLCEVVSVIAEAEKWEMMVRYVRQELQDSITSLGFHEALTKNEFEELLRCPNIAEALEKVAVDSKEVAKLTDLIYESNAVDSSGSLHFDVLMYVILQFRGNNKATVKDLIEQRKAMNVTFNQFFEKLEQLDPLHDAISRIEQKFIADDDDEQMLARKHKIKFCIIGAKGLPNRDSGGKYGSSDVSDPYAVATLVRADTERNSIQHRGMTCKTNVMYDSLDPIWNSDPHDFFDVVGADKIEIRVYDRDPEKPKDDILGTTVFRCKQALPMGFDGDLPLESSDGQHGTVQIKISVPAYSKSASKRHSWAERTLATSVVSEALMAEGQALMAEPAEAEPAEEPSIAASSFLSVPVEKAIVRPVDAVCNKIATPDSSTVVTEMRACMEIMRNQMQASLLRGQREMMNCIRDELRRDAASVAPLINNSLSSVSVGMRVRIVAMAKADGVNGKYGNVLTSIPESNSWNVLMNDGSTKLFAAENLEVCSGGHVGPLAYGASVGNRVCISGLDSRPELNGKVGTVVSWDDSSRRWRVRLDDGTRKLVKSDNIDEVSAEAGVGLAPGGCVRICGLQQRQDLNGVEGVCSSWDEQERRWRVTLNDGSGILVQASQLKVLDKIEQQPEVMEITAKPGAAIPLPLPLPGEVVPFSTSAPPRHVEHPVEPTDISIEQPVAPETVAKAISSSAVTIDARMQESGGASLTLPDTPVSLPAAPSPKVQSFGMHAMDDTSSEEEQTQTAAVPTVPSAVDKPARRSSRSSKRSSKKSLR